MITKTHTHKPSAQFFHRREFLTNHANLLSTNYTVRQKIFVSFDHARLFLEKICVYHKNSHHSNMFHSAALQCDNTAKVFCHSEKLLTLRN